ncbi:hypothetical protein VPHK45_0014 [Vibrio phage K45]
MVWVGLSRLAKCDVGHSSRSVGDAYYIYIFLLKKNNNNKTNIKQT